jgi:hypothetical protein
MFKDILVVWIFYQQEVSADVVAVGHVDGIGIIAVVKKFRGFYGTAQGICFRAFGCEVVRWVDVVVWYVGDVREVVGIVGVIFDGASVASSIFCKVFLKQQTVAVATVLISCL